MVSEIITKREVFYLSGYDPRGYRFYFQMYKKHMLKQNKINHLNAQINSKPRKDNFSYSWKIQTKDTQTNYNFLIWDDIIRQNWSTNMKDTLKDNYIYVKRYIFSGLTHKMSKINKHGLLAMYYPVVYNLISIILIFVALGILYITLSNILNIFVIIPTIFTSAYFMFQAQYKLGKKLGVHWLGNIYAFSIRQAYSEIDGFEERIDHFSKIICEEVKKDINDEILIIGHSVGASLLVPVAAKVIEFCHKNSIRTRKIKLLTLGNCIPLVSFPEISTSFKKDLEILAHEQDIVWINYASMIDGASSGFTDLLECVNITNIKGQGTQMLSTRFHKLFSKTTYSNIRYDWYQVHFLYLMSSELRGEYDYFKITAGNKPLQYKINKKE